MNAASLSPSFTDPPCRSIERAEYVPLRPRGPIGTSRAEIARIGGNPRFPPVFAMIRELGRPMSHFRTRFSAFQPVENGLQRPLKAHKTAVQKVFRGGASEAQELRPISTIHRLIGAGL